MSRYPLKGLLLAGLGFFTAAVSAQDADPELVAQARALSDARSEATFIRQCTVQPARFPGLGQGVAAEPVQLFDNLYYVGRTDVGAWVIETSDGLALIDTLYNAEDAEQIIEGGIRQLGLDPEQLKVAFVTHSHGDHSGGAPYFQERGVRVMLSEADWGPLGGAPGADSIASDGQTIMLGDTPITVVLTPGHTPGSISLVFPVFENEQQYMAVVMGLTPRGGVDVHQQAVAGLEHLAEFADRAGINVVLHTHEMIFDPVGQDFIMSGANRTEDAPNPLIIGEQNVQRFADMVTTCWKARIATMQAAG